MQDQRNTSGDVTATWKVCVEQFNAPYTETTLTALPKMTDKYPEHAYYDADYGCYCYDFCPNPRIYLGIQGATYMSQYVSPVIFTIGAIGNLMILIMFLTKDLKNMPSRPFFQALAISDTIALISGLLMQFLLEGFEIHIMNSDVGCKLRYFSVYVSVSVSAWLIAALSIDRFVSVTWPMKARLIMYKHRVIVIASLYVMFGMLYSHLLVYYEYSLMRGIRDVCLLNQDLKDENYNAFMLTYFNWCELVVKFLFPLLVILVCNIGMVNAMRKSEESDVTSTKTDTQASKRLTVLVIVIGIVFVVTVAPWNIYAIRDPVPDTSTWRTTSYEMFIGTFCRTFAYTNHALNIFLYCIVGSKFRSALTSLVRCRHK